MDEIDKELSEFVKGKIVIDAKTFDDEVMKIYFSDGSELIIVSELTQEAKLGWIMSTRIPKS